MRPRSRIPLWRRDETRSRRRSTAAWPAVSLPSSGGLRTAEPSRFSQRIRSKEDQDDNHGEDEDDARDDEGAGQSRQAQPSGDQSPRGAEVRTEDRSDGTQPYHVRQCTTAALRGRQIRRCEPRRSMTAFAAPKSSMPPIISPELTYTDAPTRTAAPTAAVINPIARLSLLPARTAIAASTTPKMAAPRVMDVRPIPARISDPVTSSARRMPTDGAAPIPRDPSTCTTMRVRTVRACLRRVAATCRQSAAAAT